MNYPPTIRHLIECFKKLPGIGEKTAERLALSILSLDDEVNDLFAESIKNVKTKIKRCQKCNNLPKMIYVIFVQILHVINKLFV